ncbi:hypothetical protein QY702_05900 [Xanthomonas campestris pv. plantaginis]|uniref:hypothetical protein n=1 Tax=Xanthomonas campestris TaxID=339 RepID=UPI002B2338C3|nr:hypothetical protein [Xanthomonas campestris]MEA9605995.1 hypothetical protein [Xanthomonas campestris pv. plantaginis]
MADDGMRIVIKGGIESYMAAADETTAELLASHDPIVAALREYDTYFREGLWRQYQPPAVPLVLCMNAYQLFLASSRMALSGHCAAVFPLLRTALESAAYASLIMHKPELQDVWTRRHQGEAEKKACRKAFTFEKAIGLLKDRAPDIHALAVLGYEGAIDYGAHPNVKGVFGHVSIDDQDDDFFAVSHTSLYGATHIETIRGLCACLDFGFAIIGIIALSSPEISDALLADLSHLNDAKNAATERYGPEGDAVAESHV